MSETDTKNPSIEPERPEMVPLPEIQFPLDLVRRLQANLIALAEMTTVWDEVRGERVLRFEGPHCLVIPLRSGPIVFEAYRAYCDRYKIPQPSSFSVLGVGGETREAFILEQQVQDQQYEYQDWESEEGQNAFLEWLISGGTTATTQAITQIRQEIQTLNLDPEETVRLLFIDDAGGEHRDVRDRVAPAIVKAALPGRKCEVNFHLLIPQKAGIVNETHWLERIIKDTFGEDIPYEQCEFLAEVMRGGLDDSKESGVLNSEADLQKLGEVLTARRQYYLDTYHTHGARVAINGFEPLFVKYGRLLLNLHRLLRAKLSSMGEEAPSPMLSQVSIT